MISYYFLKRIAKTLAVIKNFVRENFCHEYENKAYAH